MMNSYKYISFYLSTSTANANTAVATSIFSYIKYESKYGSIKYMQQFSLRKSQNEHISLVHEKGV